LNTIGKSNPEKLGKKKEQEQSPEAIVCYKCMWISNRPMKPGEQEQVAEARMMRKAGTGSWNSL
jgi:hypothetical protein